MGAKTFQVGSPFILMSDGNGSLTTESVKKPMGLKIPQNIRCQVSRYGRGVTCNSVYGGSLYFDSESSKGGFSTLFGTADADPDLPDSVMVSAFECTKG